MNRLIGILLIFSMKIQAQTIDIQGHRGARGLMPENTLEAFIEALKYDVTTLELDVVISRDHKVIVSHEPYMNSLFCNYPNGKPVTKADESSLNLYHMNYSHIKKYDTGSRGNVRFPEQQKIKTYKPLLSEVIKKVDKFTKEHNLPKVNFNIEIKSEANEYNISQPNVAEFSDLVYKQIKRNIDLQRVTVQSFDFAVLKYWQQNIEKSIFKKVKLAALVETQKTLDQVQHLGFKPDILSPLFTLLTSDIISQYHTQGTKVIPWTVNETADLIKIKEMGVDGIITDYPNRWKDLHK